VTQGYKLVNRVLLPSLATRLIYSSIVEHSLMPQHIVLLRQTRHDISARRLIRLSDHTKNKK